ncbi:CLUMA_CG010022, isoform A [Clunio marinus]|uniref:CLUMA_CG010022, isoform A n=1 Tax=Clunio marinus TaxID=568069 RepID=A0A1J1I9D8_9DIPT|nr:CLUMA_CG010022, isoform A [Clunio marinus]
MMQKFVVKKVSRSTNITISSDTDDQNLLQCSDDKRYLSDSEDLEISSVKMCGYLKKKRNRVGGWTKLYFVLQNSLLMSYNSKEEYEKKLVSFKNVICLIPGNTVLIPSLEPRFTIASNLNTFYTFRCDDNRTCSKWITAILECLSRDIDLETSAKKPLTSVKSFRSQQNLSKSPITISQNNQSWENLPRTKCIANHNGRILLELNYMNCNRAKLPIAAKTAKILQKCSDNDVITTTKKVNFIQQQHDENKNFLRSVDHNEPRKAFDDENGDQFRLHNAEESKKRQSKEVDQISKMFTRKSESQRPENLTHSNGNDYSEIGIEVQMQTMNFGYETGDYSSIYNNGNYQSVDSTKLNNKLSIENINDETYAEIRSIDNLKNQLTEISMKEKECLASRSSDDSGVVIPVYASVDLKKKKEARREKSLVKKGDDEEKIDECNLDNVIYEDVGLETTAVKKQENNIYELIDLPLRSSKKTRSLVWKNWSRIHLFDFTKRYKDSDNSSKSPSPDTISKRQKTSLTLSEFSKRFNYRSMRNKARKMCTRSNSTFVTTNSNADVKVSTSSDTRNQTNLEKT